MQRSVVLVLVTLWMGCPGPVTTSSPPVEEPRAVEDPVKLVNVLMGTGGWGFNHGSASPGASVPNGMVKAGPDTRGEYGTINFLHYSGYWYGDDTIMGFSQMHLHGAGATDYGIISVMPTTENVGPAAPAAESSWSTFAKSSEVAEPGYYSVTLDRSSVKVEITASTHVARYRFTYPQGASANVLLDLDRTLNGGSITAAHVEMAGVHGKSLNGWVDHVGGMSGGFGGYRLYFHLAAKAPFSPVCWKSGAAPAGLTGEIQGTSVGCSLGFGSESPVELDLALSFVGFDKAEASRAAEVTTEMDFTGMRQSARSQWDGMLSRIRVYGGTEEQLKTFYSSLHHGFMMPTITQDSDGAYQGHDGEVHHAEGFHYVTDLSLWDTYRTLHPLYDLMAQDRALDVVQSLHAMAREGGFFPKWPIATGEAGTMIGSSAEIILADSYVKGVRGFDAEGAYGILRAAAMERTEPAHGRGGRDDVIPYMDVGYVPVGVGRAPVSMTLEYAHNDFALGNLARALGHDSDADALLMRRKGYAHLLDAATGFLRAKNADGSLRSTGAFDPTVWDDAEFAEANAWQSVFGMPHDVEGMVEMFGGTDAAVAKLSELFEKSKSEFDALDPEDLIHYHGIRPYYFHGNEPDLHFVYMFSQLGRRDLMAKWLDWARTTFHNSTPDGLWGNDDGGTLGAWYVFSALGFYPVAGSDQYIVGSPLFPKVEIRVGEGVFTVVAEHAGEGNIFVKKVELNGRELTGNQFSHADIRAGGTLKFVMDSAP